MPDFFDPNGPGANLQNFGFGAMAAGGVPGATTLGALGQGGMAMNQAALQNAQRQQMQAQTQGVQNQNQLFPLQLEFMKFKMQQLQKSAGQDDDNLADGGGGAGIESSPTLGSTPTAGTRAQPSNSSMTTDNAHKILDLYGEGQPDQAQPPAVTPDMMHMQNQIAKLTKRINMNQLVGLPTTADENNLKAINERLTAAQKTQQDIAAAGPKKEAEDTGTNSSQAGKTLNVMLSNLPVALKRFQELREAAPSTSFGLGAVGDDKEPGWKQTIAYQLAPYNEAEKNTASANTTFLQKTAQGVLPEIGPQLAQAGIKGNKFLETLANEASGIDMRADPESKLKAIQGLEDQYIRNLKSTAAQVRRYGGQAPRNEEIDSMAAQMKGGQPEATQPATPPAQFNNPAAIGQAFKAGKITREEARKLLQQNHGFQ